MDKIEFASPKCFCANGPVGKKVNIGKIYNYTNNDRQQTKQKTKNKRKNFLNQDSGTRFDLYLGPGIFFKLEKKNWTQFKSLIITCKENLECN